MSKTSNVAMNNNLDGRHYNVGMCMASEFNDVLSMRGYYDVTDVIFSLDSIYSSKCMRYIFK